MSASTSPDKYIGASDKYKSVYLYITSTGRKRWLGIIYRNKRKTGKRFDTDREAAKYVDIELIKQGKEPVNILKKK